MKISKNLTQSDTADNGRILEELRSLNVRLDALLRVLLEIEFNKGNSLKYVGSVKLLKSAGLNRQDISRIFGKKIAEIDSIIYRRASIKPKSTKLIKQKPIGEDSENGDRENII